MDSTAPDRPKPQKNDLTQILMAESFTAQAQAPWDLINRTVHTGLGKLRMENNPIQLPDETKLDRLIKKYWFPTGDTFTVENIDVCFGEAPGRRLQEGTNHKRAFTTSHLPILQQLQVFFNPNEKQTESETPSHKRSSTEDPEYERCAYDRRRLHLEHNPQLTVEHEAMSGNSPGKRKRHSQHSSIPNSPDLLSSDSKSSPTDVHEVMDSADEDENNRKNISVKRVKRSLKQHSTEVVAAHPTERKQDANTRGDERENKEVHHSAQAEIPKWDAASSYLTRMSSAIRDFGDHNQSNTLAPAIGKLHRSQKIPVFGGTRPMNRLGEPNNTTPAYTASAAKPFNLTRSSGSGYNPNKRQKVERNPLSSNTSLREVIDLEPDPSQDKSNGIPSTARSWQAQSQNSHRKRSSPKEERGGVDEYRHVEQTVKAKNGRKKRRESSTDGQERNTGGPGRFKKAIMKHGEALSTENPDDPIESDIEEVRVTKSNASRKPKTIVQVEIPNYMPPGQYQGTAFRGPARPKVNGKSSREPIASTTYGPKESQYVVSQSPQQQRRSSNISNLANERSPSRSDDPSTRLQTRNSDKMTASNKYSKRPQEFDNSLDDLSVGHYPSGNTKHYKEAQGLLGPRQQKVLADQTQTSTSIPEKRNTRRQDLQLNYSSDEDRGRGDIPPTKFSEPKKTRQRKILGQERYDVVLVFSETNKWLVESSNNQWSLIHNTGSGELILLNGDGDQQWRYSTAKIEKIEFKVGSSQMIIHKARDMSTGGGIHIHLELHDADQSATLRENLKSEHKTIGLISKEGDYISRVHDKIRSQKPQPKRKRPSVEEQPADVQLMVRNKEHRTSKVDRVFDDALDRKKRGSGSSVGTARAGQDSTYALQSKGIAKSMRTRSGSILLEEEEGRPFKRPPLAPADFYSTPERVGVNPVSSTRSSARVSGKEPALQQPIRERSPTPQGWTTLNPGWDDEWQSSIVYPRDAKDKATVDKQDIERLDEGKYLNDNLISFYLRWLETRLKEKNTKLAKRVYFHNTFFYERLTKNAKGKTRIDYEAVQRWTAKVDLLSYDYIIVPINEHTHWYVAIICNAPKLLTPDTPVVDYSQSQEDTSDGRVVMPDTISKSPPSSPTPPSPIQRPGVLPDPAVNSQMEGMSLEDKPSADFEQEEWPAADEEPLFTTDEPKQGTSPDGYDRPDERGVEEDLDMVVSDLQPLPAKKPAQKAKGKRKSFSRKYNTKEPRIITLDSLGISHSPTCANLREYLVAEIKAKKQQDIPHPGSIGMTAKHIPQQTNYCDCGLFLLSYIEMFLEKGDDFIHGLLQNSEDLELDWPKASEMRANIRDLLFDLQKEQITQKERLRKEKGKGKRAPKAERKPEAHIAEKLDSRELSRSARVSPQRVVTNEGEASSQMSSKARQQKPTVESSTLISKANEVSESIDLLSFVQPTSSSTTNSREIVDLNDGSQEVPVSQEHRGTEPKGILAKIRSFVMRQPASNYDQKTTDTNTTQFVSSNADIVEIPDSPLKHPQDRWYQNQGSFPKIHSLEVQESDPLNHQDRAQEENEHTQSNGVGHIEYLQLPDHDGNDQEEHRRLRQGIDATHLESPSPESQDQPTAVHLRKATPYPHQKAPSPQLGQLTDLNHIIDLDLDDDSVQLIPANEDERESQNTYLQSDDAEMLLLNDSQDNSVNELPNDPELLTDSRPNSPKKTSAFDSLQERQAYLAAGHDNLHAKRAMTPPLPERRDIDDKFHHTVPSSARKRRPMADSHDLKDLNSRKLSTDLRDVSDLAVIGKYGQKHTKYRS